MRGLRRNDVHPPPARRSGRRDADRAQSRDDAPGRRTRRARRSQPRPRRAPAPRASRSRGSEARDHPRAAKSVGARIAHQHAAGNCVARDQRHGARRPHRAPAGRIVITDALRLSARLEAAVTAYAGRSLASSASIRHQCLCRSQFQPAVGEGEGNSQTRVRQCAASARRTGGAAEKPAPGGEARKREQLRFRGFDLCLELGARVASERASRQLLVHAAGELGDVGEAQAPLRHFPILFRPQQSRRQPDRVEGRPEPVLRMRVIGPALRGHRSRRGAAEDDPKPRPQHVGQHMAGPAQRPSPQIVWL